MQTEKTEKERQKPKRSDTGPRITGRDLDALVWIAQQYAVRLDHLQVLLARLVEPEEYAQQPKEAGWITAKRALAVVRRWRARGLVEYKWILDGEPAWVWLTPAGLDLTKKDIGEFRWYEPQPGKLAHLHAVNHARLFVEMRRKDAIWTSERELKANIRIERGQKRPHMPDATTETNGRTIAIEVELSPKTYARLDKILHELATSAEYHTVWYFTQGRARVVVQAAVESMREMYRDKFVIYDMDDMPIQ